MVGFVCIQSLSPVSRIYRDIFSVCLFIIYRRNIYICFELITALLLIYKKYPMGDNSMVRSLVTDIFNSNFRFKNNFEKLPGHTTIYVSNYISDRYENISIMTLPVDICPIMAEFFVSKLKFDKILTHVITRKNSSKNNFEEIRNKVRDTLDQNISIFVYVEKESSCVGTEVGVIRSGMFSIAKELGVTITPICFDRIKYDTFGIIHKQNYRIAVGDSFLVTDIKEAIYKTRVFLREQLREFKRTKYLFYPDGIKS